MSEKYLNQYCVIDPQAFTSISELKTLIAAMGSFSGWWIVDWPASFDVSFEVACIKHFNLDEVEAKALKRLLHPAESGFKLTKGRYSTIGLENWNDLQSMRDSSKNPFDVSIGKPINTLRSLLVDKGEHYQILSPRQLYLPSILDTFLESISELTKNEGGPIWIVDPHLAPWVSNPDQDAKFAVLKALSMRLHENPMVDELILVTTWKQEHAKKYSRNSVPNPSDPESKKFLQTQLKSLSENLSFPIRIYLDQGANPAEFDTHKRFLLNRHGGIEFEYGLADRSRSKVKPKSYFGFMGQNIHKQLRETYSKCNPQRTSNRFKLLENVY